MSRPFPADSSTAAPPDPALTGGTALARRRLGVWAIVFFVISAAAPLTVVASAAPTDFRLAGIGGPGHVDRPAIEQHRAGNGGADVFTRDAEVAQGAVIEGVQFAGGATFGCILLELCENVHDQLLCVAQ